MDRTQLAVIALAELFDQGRPAPGADQMRVRDVLGTLAFMVVGLAVVAYNDRLARGLLAMQEKLPIREPTWLRQVRGSRAYGVLARSFFLLIGAWTAAGSALVVIGVLVPRPGPYPGGAISELVAVLGLVALTGLVVSRLWRTLEYARGAESRSSP